MRTRSNRYEKMTLSELIADVMRRQKMSYEGLAERARSQGVGVTAPHLCKLVLQPLIGLRENTVIVVAAATGIHPEIVAAAAMRSWGYHLYRAPRAGQDMVVLSPEPLTADQVGEVASAHDQVIHDIESEEPPDSDSRAIVPGSAPPALDHELPNQRAEPRPNNGRRSRRIATGTPHPG